MWTPMPFSTCIISSPLHLSLQEERPERKSHTFCLRIQTTCPHFFLFKIILQMRPSFVVSLLLLSLLLTKAQGIRLGKGSLVVQQQKQHDHEESALLKRSNIVAEDAILCRDEQCTGKIKNRKLVNTSTSTATMSENVNNGGNEGHDPLVNGNTTRSVKVNGGPDEIKVNTLTTTSKHRDLPDQEQYPDLVEIAEMDYSPARRKPPIHN